MEILNQDLLAYAEAHTSQEKELLKEVNRNTQANVLMPRMLSGHLQGRVLSMLSHMIRPNNILEIGTYTGYSALCMAEGLAEHGKLITIDINEELQEMVKQTFSQAKLSHRIEYIIGNALEVIPRLNEKFDMVFIDADKENYSNYYDLVIDHVNLNGFILADNVLWSGKVLSDKPDKDTLSIKDFNRKVQDDLRVENVLLPIRDGIMMMRKVSL